MRAAVYTRYGPPEVVQIREVEKPTPGDEEILVRVHATTVCAADWRIRKADPFLARVFNGLLRPKKVRILGMEFAGTVERTGAGVTRFTAGDRVFGMTGLQFGAHAEYLCVPQTYPVAKTPDNMSLEQAAAVSFGGHTALSFLRKANIQPGQKVLIYGASGSVGTAAVQLAKHFGAHVTGVCSAGNLALVRSLGADAVVDYALEDFSARGRVYDVVMDTVGASGFRRSLRSLKRGGAYVLVASSMRTSILGGLWCSITGAAKVIGGGETAKLAEQSLLKELIEAGQLRPVIDRRYPLAEIVEAHRYVEKGHKRGNVVVLCAPDASDPALAGD